MARSEKGRMVNLKSTAHLMPLDPGLFCVFYAAGQPIGTLGGLPGVRITRVPGSSATAVTITTMSPDGWLGATDGAALVRVLGQPTQIMVTSYDLADATREMPRLQVVQLGGAAAAPPVPAVEAPAAAPDSMHVSGAAPAPNPGKAEVAAHIQRRGDVGARLGEWMGVRGSQAWIEGFGIAPASRIPVTDIEYQAVLGKGWLSPWSEGGQYCGSRGMALPILGLRVRLKGASAEKYDVRVSASFTDGSSVGPIGSEETAEAESLAPLEAFCVEIVPHGAAAALESTVPQPAAHAGKGKKTSAAVAMSGKKARPEKSVAPAPEIPAPGPGNVAARKATATTRAKAKSAPVTRRTKAKP